MVSKDSINDRVGAFCNMFKILNSNQPTVEEARINFNEFLKSIRESNKLLVASW